MWWILLCRLSSVLVALQFIDSWQKHNRCLLIGGPARSEIICRLLLYMLLFPECCVPCNCPLKLVWGDIYSQNWNVTVLQHTIYPVSQIAFETDPCNGRMNPPHNSRGLAIRYKTNEQLQNNHPSNSLRYKLNIILDSLFIINEGKPWEFPFLNWCKSVATY